MQKKRNPAFRKKSRFQGISVRLLREAVGAELRGLGGKSRRGLRAGVCAARGPSLAAARSAGATPPRAGERACACVAGATMAWSAERSTRAGAICSAASFAARRSRPCPTRRRAAAGRARRRKRNGSGRDEGRLGPLCGGFGGGRRIGERRGVGHAGTKTKARRRRRGESGIRSRSPRDDVRQPGEFRRTGGRDRGVEGRRGDLSQVVRPARRQGRAGDGFFGGKRVRRRFFGSSLFGRGFGPIRLVCGLLQGGRLGRRGRFGRQRDRRRRREGGDLAVGWRGRSGRSAGERVQREP